MKKVFYLFFLSVFIWMVSCVEPVEFLAGNKKSILIVDGIISDRDIQQAIFLRRAYVSSNTNVFKAVTGAAVEVTENGSATYKCVEKTEGEYLLPVNFRGRIGNSYQLKIKLSTGEAYESDAQSIRPVPEIDSVYSKYAPLGVDWKGIKVDGDIVYLDTKDFPGTDDYFSWSWKLFERQDYCMTCNGGMYHTEAPYNGRCVDYPQLQRQGTIYDYFCVGNCWEIFYSNQTNVMSDIYSSGQKIQARNIAQIPYFQRHGSVLEVYQQSISPEAYRFFKLLVEQTQKTGTLIDTPPAPLIGNVKSVSDPYEGVGGYFLVSGYKVRQFWLDREEAGRMNARAIGLFEGRMANPEPVNPNPPPVRPPALPCIASKNRTPDRPPGWID